MASSSASLVDATEFESIRTGSIFYNLSGGGDAAAIISDGTVMRGVVGTCALNVQVGDNYDPVWDGSFNMGSGLNSLNFDGGGSIRNDGKLILDGSPDSYTMTVEGVTFGRGTITSSSLSGQLLESGGVPNGAVGNFRFDHSGGAYSDGGFGADF